MHDGCTPMILAARLAIEGMVEELINADADINAVDDSGRFLLLKIAHHNPSTFFSCLRSVYSGIFLRHYTLKMG